MNTYALLVTAGLFAAAYLFLCNRVTAALHPLRLELARVGTRLIAAPGMPGPVKTMVGAALDHAYSSWVAWAHVFALPVAVVLTVRDALTGRKDPDFENVPADSRPELSLFCALSTVSTLANSPLAFALFALEVLVCMVLWMPIGVLMHQTARMTVAFEEAREHGPFGARA
jgi:hypothetical protein